MYADDIKWASLAKDPKDCIKNNIPNTLCHTKLEEKACLKINGSKMKENKMERQVNKLWTERGILNTEIIHHRYSVVL